MIASSGAMVCDGSSTRDLLGRCFHVDVNSKEVNVPGSPWDRDQVASSLSVEVITWPLYMWEGHQKAVCVAYVVLPQRQQADLS